VSKQVVLTLFYNRFSLAVWGDGSKVFI